jgi:hypothetical protein
MDRRRFLATAAAGAGGIVLGLRIGRARRPAARAVFLAGGPDGVWGIVDTPAAAGGSLRAGPGGVLGIDEGFCGGILLLEVDGVVVPAGEIVQPRA